MTYVVDIVLAALAVFIIVMSARKGFVVSVMRIAKASYRLGGVGHTRYWFFSMQQFCWL